MELPEVKKALLNLGLSSWETEAYLILVRYGPQTAVDLGRLSKIARSKTYEVITRLRRKGLVMKVPPMPTKGITQKFVAINPKEVFPSRINELKETSDFLSHAYNNPQKARYPKINFYTTKETAKRFLIKLAKECTPKHIFLVNDSIKRILGFSFDQWLQTMKKKKSHFILSKDFEYISKNLKNKSFTSKIDGINYIITSKGIILDLWESQHIVLEIQSEEAVKTFIHNFHSKNNNHRLTKSIPNSFSSSS